MEVTFCLKHHVNPACDDPRAREWVLESGGEPFEATNDMYPLPHTLECNRLQ